MTHLIAHERLRAGLHIARCDCHGAIKCPSLDTRARLNEGAGQIPVGYTGDETRDFERGEDGLALILCAVGILAALGAGALIGMNLAEMITR